MVRIIDRSGQQGVGAWSIPEIEARLHKLPPEDLDGLWEIRLVEPTRYDNQIYGRYLYDRRPIIHLYMHPAEQSFRTRFGRRHLKCCLGVEVEYGLKVEDRGNCLLCRWEPEPFRRFLLEFVLLHEIGHHVCHLRRLNKNWSGCPGNQECERFADAYTEQHRQG